MDFLTFNNSFRILGIALESWDVLAHINARFDLPLENVDLVHEQEDDDVR